MTKIETPIKALTRLNADKPLNWQDVKFVAEHELAHIAREKRERKLNAFLEMSRHIPPELVCTLAKALVEADYQLMFDPRFADVCVWLTKEGLLKPPASYHAS